jgi:S-adenosylmethionine:tRNA ribosyltransferase-isomerase
MKINTKDPLKTSSYDYFLPKELIATTPVYPADEAKLLVYNRTTNEITHTKYKHLLNYLPNDISIFFNDTKVIKARLYGHKENGSKIEILFNKPLPNNQYLVYIKGRIKQLGIKLLFENNLEAIVTNINNEDGTRQLEFYKDGKQLDFISLVEIFNEIGHIPLPPYMHRDDNKKDEIDYQTLFAKNYGAVAAPTASLHFTPKLLDDLKNAYETYYLTLHVGAGTFKPVEATNILDHPMHSEYFDIPTNAIDILNNNTPILAVGTTVTRTIEYYHRTKKITGECDLFLNPNNKPQRVNHLLTNFHLPKSTLIMLIASFVGLEKTMELYDIAIKNNYRFYSYGDGMLII